jgi:hypothetical protein
MVNIFDKSNNLAGSQALFDPNAPVNPAERLINIVDSDGKGIGSVPESKLPDYIKQGYHIESDAQKKQNDFIEDNSGTAGAFKTALAYGGNELGFGLPKELIKLGLSDDKAKELDEEYKGLGQANPITAGAATGAGFLGSMALGGGLFKGAAKAGQLAEGLVTGGRAAEELGLGTKLLSKAAGGAVENAVVGGALSAPQVINQVRQGNPQEAAEALIVNAGLGSLLGAGLGVGGEAVKAGVSKLFGGGLEQFSTDQTIRSLIHSTDQKANELIDQTGRKDVADYVKSNNLFRDSTFDDLSAKISARKQDIGTQIGAETDKLASNVPGPSTNELFGRINKEVIDPLMENGATRAKGKQVQSILNDMEQSLLDSQQQRAVKEGWIGHTDEDIKDLPVSVGSLNNQRKALDTIIYDQMNARIGNPSPLDKELKNVRNIFKDQINEYAEKTLGSEWTDKMAGLNKEYKILSTLDEVADRSATAEQKNQQFALKDIIAGAGMLGHPAGIPGAIAMGAGSKILRKRGNEWLAKAADFSNNSILNAANDNINNRLSIIPKILNNTFSGPGIQAGGNSLARTLSDAGIKPDDSSKNKDVAAYNTFAGLITKQMSQPQDNIMNHAATVINSHDPQMANQLGQSASGVINYLHQQMPKATTPQVPFQPPWEPNPQQLKAFASTVQVAQDPFIVLDKLADGSLNQNHVQTLKALYPSIYAKMVDEIKAEGMKKDAAKMPYNKKLHLSLLIGQPLDPSLNNVQSLQDSYASNQEQSKPLAEGKLDNLPAAQQTEMQRVQSGEPAA